MQQAFQSRLFELPSSTLDNAKFKMTPMGAHGLPAQWGGRYGGGPVMGGSGAYSPGPVMGSSGPYHTGPVMGGGGLTSTIPVRSAGGPDHVVSHVAGQKVKDGARIDVTMILMYAGIAYAVYYFVLR